jgi:phage terminase small subunit
MPYVKKGKGTGRHKQPIQVHALAGFPDKRSRSDQVRALSMMLPSLGEVFIPEHLHEDAQGCLQVIKDSMPVGIYSKLDTFMLAAFACAWAAHKRAAHEMNNPNFQWVVNINAINTNSGRVSPWVKLMFEAGKQMATLGDRLGLNPGVRQGLRLPTTLENRDPYEDLIELNASSSSSDTTSKSPAE